MATFVDALSRMSVRVIENGSRRTYAWRNVKPTVTADDLDAVLSALMSLSLSQVLDRLLIRQQNII
ncbi:MAG: hypothetical protein H5T91_02200 [Synergistetes bacterium]|nr:MAG: hypothetical protein XD52_0984 [bacterium 42_11]MBC7331230.1 hypothetical protein [Synergistota bacterium]MDK2871529.1 hypothetical protein [bacterium]